MSGTLPLIVTRADPGGAATAARAQAMGLDARHLPLFEARPLAWVIPEGDFDALLATSAQALRLAGPRLQALANLPVWAVGEATAEAARMAGMAVAAAGTADAQALLDAMASAGIGRALWLCGRERSKPDSRGIDLVALPVYAVDEVDPGRDWSVAIAAPAAVLAHSTRGAARIAALAGTARKHLLLVAISEKAAAAAGDGWAHVAIAARPDDAAMLAQAHALCHKGQ